MSTSVGIPARKGGLSFDKLSETASIINSASRQLNDSIEHLNDALKLLNLGIPVWLKTWELDDSNVRDVEEIGYARVRGKWGISIRKTVDFQDGSEPDGNEWQFADAPRYLRIRAIEFLPQLMQKLNDDAEEVAGRLSERAKDAEAFAIVIRAAAQRKTAGDAQPLPGKERGK
jgi:hypothetical protein